MRDNKSPFNKPGSVTTQKQYSPFATEKSRNLLYIGIASFLLIPVEVVLTAAVFGESINPVYMELLVFSVTALFAVGGSCLFMSFFPME